MGKIIDFFFPMIDKPKKDEIEKEQERYQRIKDEINNYIFQNGESDLILKLAEDYEKREDARLHEVESKATVFIGTFSVAVTILMSLLKDFITGSSSGGSITVPYLLSVLIPIMLGLAIFYLCFAIINSVKTLQRNTFNVLGVKEILNVGSYASIIIEANREGDKKKITENLDHKKVEIARKRLLYTFMNENVINRKVEHMSLAQDFFMHAVVVLVIMLAMLAGYLVWRKAGNHIIDFWDMIVSAVKAYFGKSITSSTTPVTTPTPSP